VVCRQPGTSCRWRWAYPFTSRFTICGDACPLSCVNAEACLTGWPSAWVCSGVGS